MQADEKLQKLLLSADSAASEETTQQNECEGDADDEGQVQTQSSLAEGSSVDPSSANLPGNKYFTRTLYIFDFRKHWGNHSKVALSSDIHILSFSHFIYF